jgi:hypothetical protein
MVKDETLSNSLLTIDDKEKVLYDQLYNKQEPTQSDKATNSFLNISSNDTPDYYTEYFKLQNIEKVIHHKVLQADMLKSNNVPHVNTFNQTKELKYQIHKLKPLEIKQKAKPPGLESNLDIVVKNPGIYPLSSIIKTHKNDDLDLFTNLPTPDMINFDIFSTYMSPSKDKNLHNLMKEQGFKYASSTSGISAALAHFFYKLTNFKNPHFYNLSQSFINQPLKFMMYQRKPTSIILERHTNNCYTVNKNSMFDNPNEIILLKMGKYMEKLFTTTTADFKKKYIKSQSSSLELGESEEDFFKFISYDQFLLRSQIDCQGKDANGKTIHYEIKTRAVAPIRYCIYEYQDYLDYEVEKLQGLHSSYEREYYDLIRGAFLKYYFQLKIGGMDGAFISYHNTQKIFGFEYIKLVDMERRLFGNSNFSDVIFKASIKLLQETLEVIIKDFNNEKLIIGIFANEWTGVLDILIEPIDKDTYSDFYTYNVEEIVDYYHLKGYRPKVYKYSVYVNSLLNNVVSTFSPIFFENNDTLNVRYFIQYEGLVSFDQYMKFVKEAYSYNNNINMEHEYTGSWSMTYEK